MAQTDTREPGLHSVTVTVNGTRYTREVEPRQLLVYFVREQLGLTGTHVGCDTSQCGACTILLDGVAVKACTILAVQVDGAEIKTIEGVSPDGNHPIQRAWKELDAPQCGYCQSGMIMSALALLERNSNPTDADIDAAVTNACRCSSYHRVRKAIHLAADLMKA